MATRYIGLKEICSLTGKSHPTLWRMWSKKESFQRLRKAVVVHFWVGRKVCTRIGLSSNVAKDTR